MNAIKKAWLEHPSGVIALVQTFIALLIAFGLELTPSQIGAIMAMVTCVGGLVNHTQVTSTRALQQYSDAVDAQAAEALPPEVS